MEVSLAQLVGKWMYNPTTRVQVFKNVNLGSYLTVGSPLQFSFKKEEQLKNSSVGRRLTLTSSQLGTPMTSSQLGTPRHRLGTLWTT